MIRIEQVDVPTGNNVELTYFDPGSGAIELPIIDVAFESALASGISGANTQSTWLPPCATGNCTRPEYRQFGYTSKCVPSKDIRFEPLESNPAYAELTELIDDHIYAQANRTIAQQAYIDQLLYGYEIFFPEHPNNSVPVNSSLYAIIQLVTGNETETGNSDMLVDSHFTSRVIWPLNLPRQLPRGGYTGFFWPLDHAGYVWQSGTYAGIRDPLLAIGYVSLSWSLADENNSTSQVLAMEAEECAMTLSTTVMRTSMINGRLVNEVVEERIGVIAPSTHYEDIRIHSWFASDPDADDATQVPYVADDMPHGSPRPLNALLLALMDKVTGVVDGTTLYHCPADNNTNSILLDQCRIDTEAKTQWLGKEGRQNQTSWTSISSAAIGDRALREPGGKPAVMEGTARSLTDLHYLQGNATLLGTEFVLESRVRIQWGWVALPMAPVILTVAALLGVILQAKRTDMGTWKSSSLPHVFASEKLQLVERKATPANITKGTTTRPVVSEMMAEAKQTRIELRREAKHTEADGWRMVIID